MNLLHISLLLNLCGLGLAHASDQAFQSTILPILEDYCIDCHSAKRQKGDLDLERFQTMQDVYADVAVWQHVDEQLELEEMPPRDKSQPLPEDREALVRWVQETLQEVARESAGDPGPVVVRRLSNAEYTYTIRDLTGVESLDPTREFPVDGAAGEGFTNAGAALVMSPALFTKYLDAGKEVASHAVLLPHSIEFSEKVTRRDWTEEKLAALRDFYGKFTVIGKPTEVNVQEVHFKSADAGVIPLDRYLLATLDLRNREDFDSKTLQHLASSRGLSSKYLNLLWEKLDGTRRSAILDPIREKWRSATPDDVPALISSIELWQSALWKFSTIERVGRPGGPSTWQRPSNPEQLDQNLLDRLTPGSDPKDLTDDFDDFRSIFPAALCYQKIVPIDSVVTLLLYFREDTELRRLMLDDAESAELDRLWEDLHFVSEDAITQVDVFEQLWQFATQGGEENPEKNPLNPLREPILKRATEFRAELIASEPAHLDTTVEFAAKAWRRPLSSVEDQQLRDLYQNLRKEELPHDAAIRLLIARILVAPNFLYKLEEAGPKAEPVPVSSTELATRLSYFLWSTTPDVDLKSLAVSGQLLDPAVLASQAKQMLRSPNIRRLAIEFGSQWLHVRDFDQLDEKSETHFPDFAEVKASLDEEPVRFFTDFFQNDRSILDLLDADHAFVNGTLANYYGLSGIEGNEWRRIENAKSMGRGGVLGFGATLAMQSGASRTSPILRGNWICETLLGERLPRPPKGVPVLPEEPPDGLTERELTAKHSSDPSCARCHTRIDPFGFSLEHYDAIGRFRLKDAAGLPINASAKTPDGAEFVGIDGLRNYLLTQRRDDFIRQFCRKLLGYALGRGVLLSDEPLLDEIQDQLEKNDHRISTVIGMIVRSRQFREIRGRNFSTTDPHNP